MRVKLSEIENAKILRKQGQSINQISKILSVAKSSISIWVRDIQFNEDQKKY